LNVEEPTSGDVPISGGYASKVKNLTRKHRTFLKFALVGASGVLVNEIVLFLLTRGKILPDIPAQAIGVELSIINNFIWNDRFTFRHRKNTSASKLHRFAKYNFLSLLTFAVNLTIFSVLIYFNFFDIYSSIIAIIAAFGINYFGSSKWAWRQRYDVSSDST
jgi:putative flippase GtrA